jgi:hypothetical protein
LTAEVAAVSVVIPTYQRRRFVMRAVQSVLAQTMQDFEVIVVDDGSSDGTAEALAEVDPRVRHIWQSNRGVSAARNTGIKLAEAPVVAFLDSDDRWRPEHLAVVSEALRRHPSALLATTCPHFHVGGRVREADLHDARPLMLAESLPGYPSCVAARRAALLEAGLFDERLEVFEDRDLWLRLSLHGPAACTRRHTVVRQNTLGTPRQRGARRNEYLRAYDLSARRMIDEIRRVRPADEQAAAEAQAMLAFATALRAARASDDDALLAAVATACTLFPRLSGQPVWVAKRVRLVTHGTHERATQFAALARAWPDPDSDTALLLHWVAIAAAVRAGRRREGLELAMRAQLRAAPGFLFRAAPRWPRLFRHALQAYVHRGWETA